MVDAEPVVPGLHRAEAVDDHTAELLRIAESEPPTKIARHLSLADSGLQARAVNALQRQHGNAFVESVLTSLAASAIGRRGSGKGTGAGIGRGETLTLEREVGDEEPAEEPIPQDQTDIPVGSTETIGPETSSSYSVAAVSIGDLANQISSRDEAGQCGWNETWNYTTMGGKINAVSVTVTINVEMPSWTPPPSMLPKAKAEWNRWYAALLAHEQGHVKLVHDKFDGLAAKILGKTARAGGALFNGAKAELRAASRAYDARTGHGTKAGTIIDVSIEDKEIDEKKKEDEAKKKKEEAEKSGKKAEVESESPAEVPA